MEQTGAVAIKNVYDFQHIRKGVVIDVWRDLNLIPAEGLTAMLGIMLHADAQLTGWYMGLGSGNYTVAGTDTAATITALVTEITTYTGNRPQVVFTAAAAASITNTTVKATFTFNATVATVTNAFVMSAATGSAGVLLSSLKLATAKTGFISGDQLVASFTMTAASV